MSPAVLVKSLTVAGLIAIMLSMGFKVRYDEVLGSIRQYRLVASGLVANFVLVPAATAALLYLLNPNPMVAVGFLILAVCPGAPVGPPFAAVARGDAAYATGLMVILAGLSALVSPFLLGALLARLLPASQLQIDHLAIAATLLVSQLLPLALGLGVHHWAPKFTSRVAKPIDLAANLLLLGAVVFVLVSEYESLRTIKFRDWMGMFLLLAASLAIGWICGGSDLTKRKSLAVTTAIRNAAVALVIASSNFANTGAVTSVVAYAFVSIFATLGCAYVFAALPRPNGLLTNQKDPVP
jgi:bile acid:Na+ symporter, BASS family